MKYGIADLNQAAKDIFEQNKKVGWWDDPDRCIFTTIMLAVTEIAEATEGERKNLMDDHLPHRRMGEVELADAKIRMLDIGGRFSDVLFVSENGFKYAESSLNEDSLEHLSDKTIGFRHLLIVKNMVDFSMAYERWANGGKEDPILIEEFRMSYQLALFSITACSVSMGYDIFGAMEEKLEFNANRKDHKREERAKEHGKKF